MKTLFARAATPAGTKKDDATARRLSRRDFLQRAVPGMLAAGALVAAFPAFSLPVAASEGAAMLTLYFSHSGNTRTIATFIHEHTGGDMVELVPAAPYPADYDAVVEQARQELRSNARPRVTTELPRLAEYQTLFIGFPNWWGTMPMPLFTWLEQHDLAGKTIAPFCTHGGGGFGRSLRDLRRLCPRARLLDGLEIRGGRVAEARPAVEAWLRQLGF